MNRRATPKGIQSKLVDRFSKEKKSYAVWLFCLDKIIKLIHNHSLSLSKFRLIQLSYSKTLDHLFI